MTKVNSPQSIFRRLFFFPFLFLLIPDCALAEMPDNWKKVSPIGFERLFDVAYGNGTWAIVSSDGVQLISSDGVAWSSGDHEPLGTSFISYGGGAWIAGFQHLWRSEDLVTWTQVLDNGGSGVTFSANSSFYFGHSTSMP